jgi:tRNA (cmo5U34)-methyltransferase
MSNINLNTQNEWLTKERLLEYLSKANNIPHRTEGESVLLDHIPLNAKSVLNLGTRNGRLIKILNEDQT